jgi:esterase
MSTSAPVDLNFLESPDADASTGAPAGADVERPLVILHGLLGSSQNWNSLLKTPQLRAGGRRKVFALDLRNHGASPAADTMAFDCMASDVVRFLDSQGIDKALLLGHSLGGKVGMTAALRHGDRFSKLLVEDIAPVAYGGAKQWTETAGIVTALHALDLSALKSRRDADEALATAIENPLVRAFVLSNLVRQKSADGAAFAWKCNLPVISESLPMFSDWTCDVNNSSVPTLFVGGSESQYITSEHAPALAQFFPRHRTHTIAGGGHWLHFDSTKPFLEVAADFFDGDVGHY